jgi:hypothetical protein
MSGTSSSYQTAYDNSYNLLQQCITCINGDITGNAITDGTCTTYNSYSGNTIGSIYVPCTTSGLSANDLMTQLNTGVQTYTTHMNNLKQHIVTTDSSLNQIRTDLDKKMAEVLAYDTSLYQENRMVYDSTVYTTLIWTILVTSLVYYTFTKL